MYFSQQDATRASELTEHLVGPGRPIKYLSSYHPIDNPDQYIVLARLSGSGIIATAAADTSLELARYKAIVKALEIHALRHPSAAELGSRRLRVDSLAYDEIVDPRLYAPLTKHQLHNRGLREFTYKRRVRWIRGDAYDGSPVLVPLEMVYHPSRLSDYIHYTNRSGIAVHPRIETAKYLAIEELVERDAIMRSWFHHSVGARYEPDSLPRDISDRCVYWQSQERELNIYRLPSDYGAVFLAALSGDAWPCFVAGAAASINEDWHAEPIRRAIADVELKFDLLANSGQSYEFSDDCITPADHARFYGSGFADSSVAYLKEKSKLCLFDDDKEYCAPCYGSADFSQLCENLQAVFVELNNEGFEQFQVVRAFSKKLIPMSFGYDSAHYSHQELRKPSAFTYPLSNPQFPHFFSIV